MIIIHIKIYPSFIFQLYPKPIKNSKSRRSCISSIKLFTTFWSFYAVLAGCVFAAIFTQRLTFPQLILFGLSWAVRFVGIFSWLFGNIYWYQTFRVNLWKAKCGWWGLTKFELLLLYILYTQDTYLDVLSDI